MLRPRARGAAGAALPCFDPSHRADRAVGAGDVLLGGYLSERFNGRSVGDALRTAVGCAAASVVELGAGRFDPREAARLAAGVEIVELAAVEA